MMDFDHTSECVMNHALYDWSTVGVYTLRYRQLRVRKLHIPSTTRL